MTDTKQPEALRLSEQSSDMDHYQAATWITDACAELSRQHARIVELEQSEQQLMQERDDAEKLSDSLAYQIGKHFRVDVGEHSNLNDPRSRAMEVLDGEWQTDSDADRRIVQLKAKNRELKAQQEAVGAGGVTGLRTDHSVDANKMIEKQPYAYTSTCKCGSILVAIAPEHYGSEELAMEIASWNAKGLAFEAVKEPAEIGIQQCRCAAIAQEGGK